MNNHSTSETNQDRAHRLASEHRVMRAALLRLDTETTYQDSHSPYYTFNEDDARAIRAAITKPEAAQS